MSHREYTIDGQDIHICETFRGVNGILSSNFTHATPGELDRLDTMFRDGLIERRSAEPGTEV